MLATTTIEYLTAWATLGTAIATLALAVGTFYMAAKTRDEARATRDDVDASKRQIDVALQQVELSRRQAAAAELAINAQSKPLLVNSANADAVNVAPGDDRVAVSVRLRNVGAGVARIVEAGLSMEGQAVGARVYLPRPYVAAGEDAIIEFGAALGGIRFDHLRHAVARDEPFDLWVGYTDATGGQPTITRAAVAWHPSHGNWRIRQIITEDSTRPGSAVESARAFG
jgi:hypothetical protein